MLESFDISLKDEERQPCEVWTRVMGYHRPVSQWNIGKRQEFANRKPYKIKEEEYSIKHADE
jgi:hypothetical protein